PLPPLAWGPAVADIGRAGERAEPEGGRGAGSRQDGAEVDIPADRLHAVAGGVVEDRIQLDIAADRRDAGVAHGHAPDLDVAAGRAGREPGVAAPDLDVAAGGVDLEALGDVDGVDIAAARVQADGAGEPVGID